MPGVIINKNKLRANCQISNYNTVNFIISVTSILTGDLLDTGIVNH